MITLGVGCVFAWKSEVATAAVLQVEPRTDGPEVVRHEWTTSPTVASRSYIDRFGNICRRLTFPPGDLTLHYDADVLVSEEVDVRDFDAPEVAAADLPDDSLAFTLPSRFCQSDLLADAAWEHFGQLPRGQARVQAVCDFVHNHLTFRGDSSTPTTSAVDVYESGEGVCRDFAHLMITFLRALNIPARYAFGYLPDIGVPPPHEPMDFCAWTEVFLGDRWYTFDPRNNARRAGRVLIGRGRDAVDVAMVTSYGGPELVEMSVWAESRVPVVRA
ncbi:MAG: transglutaminase family protein [Actinomycetota bacterium]|nr:transglutaminase family protein [Actinomycetota bacterium]